MLSVHQKADWRTEYQLFQHDEKIFGVDMSMEFCMDAQLKHNSKSGLTNTQWSI